MSPTTCPKWILDRDFSTREGKVLTDPASDMLVEVVNQGAAVFARCRGSAKGEVNEDVAPLYLYLHIVEMLDGVQVLVSQSCPLPAAPILRSVFEAMISIPITVRGDHVRVIEKELK